MIVCHSEHSFCTDFSVLELYLADSGKNSRSSGYFMHTENLHTIRSIHTACCRNSKSSMIVWHFEHSHRWRSAARPYDVTEPNQNRSPVHTLCIKSKYINVYSTYQYVVCHYCQ